jgi:hypothetical protein
MVETCSCTVNTRRMVDSMGQLRFDLKAAISDFNARTGLHLTYDQLSNMSGLSVDMLKSLANRSDYNVTLKSVSEVCTVLGSDPRAFLNWVDKED